MTNTDVSERPKRVESFACGCLFLTLSCPDGSTDAVRMRRCDAHAHGTE